MVKKVVAAAAATGGFVLAGAGLAVADSGTHAGAANSAGGSGNLSMSNPVCFDSSAKGHAHPRTENKPGSPHGPQKAHPQRPGGKPHHPDGKPHHPGGKPHHPGGKPHHPDGKPHHPSDRYKPGAPESPDEYEDVPETEDVPEGLAETGSEEVGLTLVAATGLILGGAILFRRARPGRR